ASQGSHPRGPSSSGARPGRLPAGLAPPAHPQQAGGRALARPLRRRVQALQRPGPARPRHVRQDRP
ncbi:hypothetical protein CFC21_045099, partial [Triticum aestivum]